MTTTIDHVNESLALGYEVSKQDLLATLFGDQVAQTLLAHYPMFHDLRNVSVGDLKALKGIGKTRAVQIKAIIELACKLYQQPLCVGDKFTSDSQIVNHYGPLLRGVKREQFIVLFLDVKNRVIRHEVMFKGSIGTCPVMVREILTIALKESAKSIVLVHNHPTGNCEPSEEDLMLTRRVRDACDLVEVNLLDHIILGDQDHTSLRAIGRI